MTPREDLLVGAPLENPDGKVRVLDVEKVTAPGVEAPGDVGQVVGWELAGGLQADLVEHATEVDKAAGFGVGAAETRNVGHGGF
jgi:hypothetical protein